MVTPRKRSFGIDFSCEEFNEEMIRLVDLGDEYNPWGKDAQLDGSGE